MALKLISALTVLMLAVGLYSTWNEIEIPEEVLVEDRWNVKTIEFICYLVGKSVSCLLLM